MFLAYSDLGRFGGCIGFWAEYSKDYKPHDLQSFFGQCVSHS